MLLLQPFQKRLCFQTRFQLKSPLNFGPDVFEGIGSECDTFEPTSFAVTAVRRPSRYFRAVFSLISAILAESAKVLPSPEQSP